MSLVSPTDMPRDVEEVLSDLYGYLDVLCAFAGALEIVRDHQQTDPRRLPAMEQLVDKVTSCIKDLRAAFDEASAEASG
jgi:hypothetical protein